MLPILLERVLFGTEGQARSRGAWGERDRVAESVLRRPHWDRPGESQPFEVVICSNLREGLQIEMSFDNGRKPLLWNDWATFRDREREGERDWDIGRESERNKAGCFIWSHLLLLVEKGPTSLFLSWQWDPCGDMSFISSPLSASWILPPTLMVWSSGQMSLNNDISRKNGNSFSIALERKTKPVTYSILPAITEPTLLLLLFDSNRESHTVKAWN